ncbi:N-acetylglutamate synthase [Viridothelium virens]|uniref:Amino-acid acetyltransferase, mitochondrial n=1 Tax=Viridothelium virens TaxID=1048519 RepID=A0A6A6HBW3_VIRVR|nr:N-acetylglutamate synthase [Viridothelium virens]
MRSRLLVRLSNCPSSTHKPSPPCHERRSFHLRDSVPYPIRQACLYSDVAPRQPPAKVKTKAAERDFIVNVLSATTTRRDAKSYISRFKTADHVINSPNTRKTADTNGPLHQDRSLDRLGVNLGGFYSTTRAADQTPRFSQPASKEKVVSLPADLSHVALVKIRAPDLLSDETIFGITSTLSQLAKLGMISVVVLDCDEINIDSSSSVTEWREKALTQADRVVTAINAHDGPSARRIGDAIGVSSRLQAVHAGVQIRGEVEVQYPNLFDATLARSTLPVVPSIAYTIETQKATPVPADDVLLALTRSLAGITSGKTTLSAGAPVHSIEKIIILDPLGGTPLSSQSKRSHVFVNLEEEFPGFCRELEKRPNNSQHIKNLELVRDTLALLPPTSSALITTPEEASRSAKIQNIGNDPLGVSTRPVKNPLIHNLLTDKPAFSSSLPAGRMGIDPSDSNASKTPSGQTTFIKRGMPLSIIPDPQIHPWKPPSSPDEPALNLEDPQIAFPRLVHLIEDSFARPLDIRHYLDRIQHHTAGVIVAGSYEGGAILTWEAPPSAPTTSIASTTTKSDPTRLVPYLDKFAVLQRSQGSGASVADIVFKAMVRDCFPKGVVWRSRENNPVNKWYFERAVGTWKIPGTNWCMFWTTPGIFDEGGEDRRWEDYVDVCRNVKASWADDRVAD